MGWARMPVTPGADGRRAYGDRMTQLIIDADTHITEPPDVWTTAGAARYLDAGAARGAQRRGPRRVGARRHAVQHRRDHRGRGLARAVPRRPADLRGLPPGRPTTPTRASSYMDEVGIWAQVLYPNVAGFGSQRFLRSATTSSSSSASARTTTSCATGRRPTHRRLITIMSMPFWDIDATVKEIERGVDAGHRGILFTGEPQRFGLPFLGEQHWDPLWSIAQEAGLPIHFHIGSGDIDVVFGPERIARYGTAAHLRVHVASSCS